MLLFLTGCIVGAVFLSCLYFIYRVGVNKGKGKEDVKPTIMSEEEAKKLRAVENHINKILAYDVDQVFRK